MTRLHRRRQACRRHGRGGQALVEFALVAPLLFLVIVAIFEGGRFVFFHEMLNHATREGARYAIVHGASSVCPSGPMPGGATNPCDPTGARVMHAVADASLGLAGIGDLFVHRPVWSPRGTLSPASRGDASLGDNGRGEYVTVFVDYTYEPIFNVLLRTTFLPTLTIGAQSTLVINN